MTERQVREALRKIWDSLSPAWQDALTMPRQLVYVRDGGACPGCSGTLRVIPPRRASFMTGEFNPDVRGLECGRCRRGFTPIMRDWQVFAGLRPAAWDDLQDLVHVCLEGFWAEHH